MVAVFQKEAFYTHRLPHCFTIKTKLRHLNKKWYPDGPRGCIQSFFTANSEFGGLNKYPRINSLLPDTQLYVNMLFTLHFQL